VRVFSIPGTKYRYADSLWFDETSPTWIPVCRCDMPPTHDPVGAEISRVRGAEHGASDQYVAVDYLLLVLGAVNAVLFTVLGVQSWRLATRIGSLRARTQAYLLALVCAAFVIGTTMRIGLQLVDVGVLEQGAREVLMTWVQLVTSTGALFIIVPALWMLRRLTAMFAKTDRFVTVLTDKVMLDASVSEAGLTARELEVLQHLASGTVSDAELAEALYISPATAATHVRNIMKKTGVNRRHELMLLAVEDDVVTQS